VRGASGTGALWLFALACSTSPRGSADEVGRWIADLAGEGHAQAHEALLRKGPSVIPRLETAFRETPDARHALRIAQVIRAIGHVQAIEALQARVGGRLREENALLYLLTSSEAQAVIRGLEQFCGAVVYTTRFERRGDGRVAEDCPNVDVGEVVNAVLPRVQDAPEWEPAKLTLLTLVAERRLQEMFPMIEAFLYDRSEAVKLYALLQVEALELRSARPRVEEMERQGSQAVQALAKRVASKLR
jgi:hypothetical protein